MELCNSSTVPAVFCSYFYFIENSNYWEYNIILLITVNNIVIIIKDDKQGA